MSKYSEGVDSSLLHSRLPGWSRVNYVAATGSTNADLLADASAPAWSVLLAGHQTAGRGRMGRPWTAPPGTQLILSVLLRPGVDTLARLGTVPLATGLALTDVVGQAGLKWPNDVLVDGRKLCGILAEAAGLPDDPRVVVGVGLNVTLTREQLPVPHATSLALEGVDVTLEDLAVEVLTALRRRLGQWEAGDPRLMSDYRAVCTSIGQHVRVELPEGQLHGDVRDVADDGRIVVRADGRDHLLSAGDVTHLRRADAPRD